MLKGPRARIVELGFEPKPSSTRVHTLGVSTYYLLAMAVCRGGEPQGPESPPTRPQAQAGEENALVKAAAEVKF